MLSKTAAGRRALAEAGFGGASIAELAERAPVIDAIERLRVPDRLNLTTIGAAGDFVVPATNAHRSGSPSIDGDPIAPFAHSAILRDPLALRAIRAALEHRSMPCLNFAQALDAAVLPVVITRVEHASAATVALTP
jgi:hypothetical protein